MELNKIHHGDCLEVLKSFPDESVDLCVTSPPYWGGLRDYEVEGQLGLEKDFLEYIEKLCNIFDEVYRVLRQAGTCWVNLGDTYSGSNHGYGDKTPDPILKENSRPRNIKPIKTPLPKKCLCKIPDRFAIKMCDSHKWILRNDIIWHKPNQTPSSVKDRFTVDFEYLFFFVKNQKYYFKQQLEPHISKTRKDHMVGHRAWNNDSMMQRGKDAVMKYNPLGRNKRTVWSINTKPCPESHYAAFPDDLINPIIDSSCPPEGLVLDPFMGSGTTAEAALKNGRFFIGVELNENYVKMAQKRVQGIGRQLRLGGA